jgi:ribonuclease P protein component
MMISTKGFQKTCRIRHQTDFDRVYQNKCYAADEVLVIHADRNTLTHSRLGLSVSKKVGGAIVRNRWKRLIREAFRASRGELPGNLDLVVRPRRGAKPNLHAVLRSLCKLVNQLDRKLTTADNKGTVGS